MKWDESLSVGIDRIDNQHKKLFKIISDYYDSIESSEDSSKILGEALKELMEYVRVHFSSEERSFKKYKYNFEKEHVAEHAKYIKKVLDFKAQYDGGKDISKEFLHFLKRWWLDHVRIHDKKYIEIIKKQRVN